MRKTLAILAAMLAFVAFSSKVQAESNFSGSVDVGAYSAYMGSTSGLPNFEGWLPQQSVTLKHNPSGVSLCVWNSASLDGRKNGGDETDVTLTISRTFGNFSVDAGYAYWAITGPDLQDIFLNATYKVADRTSLFFCLDGVIPNEPTKLEGGVLHKFGVKQSFSFVGQKFALKAFVGGHDGAFGSKPEHFAVGRVDLSTTIGVIGKLTATPVLCLQIPVNGDCETKVFGGANLSLPFGENK